MIYHYATEIQISADIFIFIFLIMKVFSNVDTFLVKLLSNYLLGLLLILLLVSSSFFRVFFEKDKSLKSFLLVLSISENVVH